MRTDAAVFAVTGRCRRLAVERGLVCAVVAAWALGGCRLGYDEVQDSPEPFAVGGKTTLEPAGGQAPDSSAGTDSGAGLASEQSFGGVGLGGEGGTGASVGGDPSSAGAGFAGDPSPGGAGAVGPPCGGCPASQACIISACVPGRRVFVTSKGMTPNLGGHAGADRICQQAADSKGLGGTWMSWISDALSSPAARFTRAKVPYLLLDGTTVASDWADLTDGALSSPINRDEAGAALVGREVWTGTDVTGAANADNCKNWSVVTPAKLATQGVTSLGDSGWTNVYLQFCDRTDVSLYCFEQ